MEQSKTPRVPTEYVVTVRGRFGTESTGVAKLLTPPVEGREIMLLSGERAVVTAVHQG